MEKNSTFCWFTNPARGAYYSLPLTNKQVLSLLTEAITYPRRGARSNCLIQRLLFAHGCTLLTCVLMFTEQIFWDIVSRSWPTSLLPEMRNCLHSCLKIKQKVYHMTLLGAFSWATCKEILKFKRRRIWRACKWEPVSDTRKRRKKSQTGLCQHLKVNKKLVKLSCNSVIGSTIKKNEVVRVKLCLNPIKCSCKDNVDEITCCLHDFKKRLLW